MKRVAEFATNFLIQASKIGAVTGASLLTLNYVGGFVVCFGPSMEPTLKTADVLLTEQISPRLKRIDIGDVVVAKSPYDNSSVCKRVVAGPGDSVLYKNKVITVPEECVWLEGDNKDNSNDSRYYGPVPYSLVRRRCFCKIWPDLDLNLTATERYFLSSTPEILSNYQGTHHHHKRKHDSSDSLREKSGGGNGVGSTAHRDSANDERDGLFQMMKTSDKTLLCLGARKLRNSQLLNTPRTESNDRSDDGKVVTTERHKDQN